MGHQGQFLAKSYRLLAEKEQASSTKHLEGFFFSPSSTDTRDFMLKAASAPQKRPSTNGAPQTASVSKEQGKTIRGDMFRSCNSKQYCSMGKIHAKTTAAVPSSAARSCIHSNGGLECSRSYPVISPTQLQ